MVVNGITAYQMLHRSARVQPGQTILVHGASGGVGSILVQLARHDGIRVIGTAAPRNHDALRALGVEPIDYRDQDVGEQVRELAPDGVDAVFDHLGPDSFRTSFALLAPGGTLVAYGTAARLDDDNSMLVMFLGMLARLYSWNLLPNKRRANFYNFWAGHTLSIRKFRQRQHADLTAVLELLDRGVHHSADRRQVPADRGRGRARVGRVAHHQRQGRPAAVVVEPMVGKPTGRRSAGWVRASHGLAAAQGSLARRARQSATRTPRCASAGRQVEGSRSDEPITGLSRSVTRWVVLRLGFCSGSTHGRGNEFGDAVGAPLDLPEALVDLRVMETAKQATVFVATDPTIQPREHVVGVGEGRWPVTPGEATPTVALGDRFADRGGEQPSGSADVQDLGLAVHHHRDDLRIAREEPNFPGGDDPAEFEVGGADPVPQVLDSPSSA